MVKRGRGDSVLQKRHPQWIEDCNNGLLSGSPTLRYLQSDRYKNRYKK